MVDLSNYNGLSVQVGVFDIVLSVQGQRDMDLIACSVPPSFDELLLERTL